MAKSEILETIRVELPAYQYPIYVGHHFLQDQQFLQQFVSGTQVFIISNTTVGPLYLDYLMKAYAHVQCDVFLLEDGEQYKNQTCLNDIYQALLDGNHHRDTTIIALGGGVVGDIAGFAASTYHRGVPFVQIPTSLLAQVDAAIGGKTAINHPLAKNAIGSFFQPKAVIIDTCTLASLPKREFQAGLAEIIKYALLSNTGFCTEIMHCLQSELTYSAQWDQIIAKCCSIKRYYVEEDEREEGKRAFLNLGHTIGHALESYTQYQRWLHGEAVAIGLYCMALLSKIYGGLDGHSVELIDSLLIKAHLPRRIPPDIDLHQLKKLLMKDKKIKNNQLRFVLLHQIGTAYIESNVSDECLLQVLELAVEGD